MLYREMKFHNGIKAKTADICNLVSRIVTTHPAMHSPQWTMSIPGWGTPRLRGQGSPFSTLCAQGDASGYKAVIEPGSSGECLSAACQLSRSGVTQLSSGL